MKTGYSAEVICDSMSPDGVRLTTVEVTFPRIPGEAVFRG